MNNEFDLKCEELRTKLVEDINEAKLPITMVCYILKDIFDIANDKKLQVIAAEQRERMKQDALIKQEGKSDGNTDEER